MTIAPSAEVTAFVLAARRYCAFIEHAHTFPLAERLATARQHLLELYAAGVALPDTEPPDGCDAGPNPPVPKAFPGFERFDIYWEVFDPYVDEPPVAGSLSDDMLDIYFDIHRGLALWDSGAPSAAAIWEWRFHLDTHWGDHAVDALRALHRACREVSVIVNEVR